MVSRKENNILPNIMNKNVLRNLNYLKRIAKNAKGDAITKVDKVVEMYSSRKIAQVQTAENMIMSFIKSNTDKQQKSVNTKYEKIIEKHRKIEPLSHRITQKINEKIVIESVEVGDADNAKSNIKINIKQNDMKNDTHLDFNLIYKSIKKRLSNEVEKMLTQKKSMKIQFVLNFIAKRKAKLDQNNEPINIS